MGQGQVGGLSAPTVTRADLPTPQAKGVEAPAARKGFVVVAGDSEAGDVSICQVLVIA